MHYTSDNQSKQIFESLHWPGPSSHAADWLTLSLIKAPFEVSAVEIGTQTKLWSSKRFLGSCSKGSKTNNTL